MKKPAAVLLALVFILLLSGCSSNLPLNNLTGDDTGKAYGDSDYSTTRGGSDKDCSDFSSKNEAQTFFDSSGSGDPHGLDRDGDGKVCETLD